MSGQALLDIIAANRAGKAVALPSLCSAHRDVLRAAMLLPEAAGQPLLIEATSNQVNQFGGYTGMTPAQFVSYVGQIADETGFPVDKILLGGDHLGPQAWKNEPADQAMEKARTMIRDYVLAGFTKIHLDCSEGCAGEPDHLDDQTIARRAAILADVCETYAPAPDALSYIIGTEVPVPGGARRNHVRIEPTSPRAARATMDVHRREFSPAATDRIVGIVVQPGVEFGASDIDHLPPVDTTGLSTILPDYDGLTFEAHSTDYQRPAAFRQLAAMGFAIQKVGPALTFAYRQAIYALDHIRADVLKTGRNIHRVLENEMLAAPNYWQNHLQGDADHLRILRHYSYSDRIRYYWQRPAVAAAVANLHTDLKDVVLPTPFLLQFFAQDVVARSDHLPQSLPLSDRLVLATIQTALAPYYFSEIQIR